MAETVRLYYFTSDKWGLDNVENRHLKLSFSTDVNDLFELKPFDFGRGEDGVKLRYAWNREIVKHSYQQGFVSFSSDWSVPTMWGHYANNHKGVCLGFDVPRYYASKMHYVPDLRPMDARVLTDESYNREMVSFARETKSVHWGYESEWRLWFSLNEAERLSRKRNKGAIIYTSFNERLVLREVRFGYRSSLSTDKFKKVLRPDDDVTFTTVRPSFQEFKMVRQRSPKYIK